MRLALEAFHRRLLAELQALDDLLCTSLRPEGVWARIGVAEYATVALQDSWARFIRDLIIRSALGGAVTTCGRQLPASTIGLKTQKMALDYLRENWPNRREQPAWWEPKWFDETDAGRAATVLRISNETGVMAAIASTTNPIDEVRVVRNFASHRLPHTAQEAASVATGLGVLAWQQPADIVGHTFVSSDGNRETVFSTWCRRFASVSRAAIV